MPRADVAEHLLAQDLILVGGGNTANMLAVWRVHGVDAVLRRGVGGGNRARGLERGRDLLVRGRRDGLVRPGAAAARGRARLPRGQLLPALRRRGGAPADVPAARSRRDSRAGYAADDAVGLRFDGTELAECVTEQEGAAAYRVERDGDDVSEIPLPTGLL